MRPELEEILQHHGVKGMHWGHHKKKEVPAEIAKAKAEVKARKIEAKDAHMQYKRESIYKMPTKKTTDAFNSTQRELKYAKEDLSRVKILNKINGKPKSKAQLKYEEKYRAKGMSADDATVAAYKRVRLNKVATAAAALTIAAVGAYAGYKVHDARVDKILKSGTTLQNIAADNAGVRDAFYSAKHGLDKSKYAGLYANTLKTRHGVAYKKEIKVLTDIKQASPLNAHKVLNDLIKNDPEFRKDFVKQMSHGNVAATLGDTYAKKAAKGASHLSKGTANKHLYEVFNAALVDHSPEQQKLTDKYFKALSAKGYNAIKDVNDSKYSGYKALNPIITFGHKGKVEVKSVKELAQKEIAKNHNVAMAHIVGSELVKSGAKVAAAIGIGHGAIKYADAKQRDKAVANYKKKNPNTKMSYNEIARMLERGKTG